MISSSVTFGGSLWASGLGNKHQNVHVLLFSRCSEQGTNLVKQAENIKGRSWAKQLTDSERRENVKRTTGGSVAQLAECLHGKREALGSSSGQATSFFFLCDTKEVLSLRFNLFYVRCCSIFKCFYFNTSVCPTYQFSEGN